MTEYFPTKEAAEEALKEAPNQCIGFCPLLDRLCRPDCVCFKPKSVIRVQITGNKPQQWYVRKECCTNAMFEA